MPNSVFVFTKMELIFLNMIIWNRKYIFFSQPHQHSKGEQIGKRPHGLSYGREASKALCLCRVQSSGSKFNASRHWASRPAEFFEEFFLLFSSSLYLIYLSIYLSLSLSLFIYLSIQRPLPVGEVSLYGWSLVYQDGFHQQRKYVIICI